MPLFRNFKAWKSGDANAEDEAVQGSGVCLKKAETASNKIHKPDRAKASGYTVTEYVTASGVGPFKEWVLGLDPASRGRIAARVELFVLGHFGDNRHLDKGLCEAQIDFGPGYRLYYGIHGQRLVLS